MVRFGQRKRWRNKRGNESAEPLRTYRVASVAGIVDIVRDAEAHGTTVRAEGSRHSCSDAARPDGYPLQPHRMRRVLDIEPALQRAGGSDFRGRLG
jgi:FAD/FMN-containing dehydrogenase